MVGKSTSALLKPYLRKLVLKVHPDYFSGDPCKRKVNEASFKKLQTLLKSEHGRKEDTQLEFYSKTDHKCALGKFSAASSDWRTAESFFHLCKQLDIQVLPSDAATVEQMISRQERAQNADRRSLTEEFAEALYRNSGKTVEAGWTPQRVTRNNLLMFHHEVDKLPVVNNLCQWLPHLRPNEWWGKLPVIFIPPMSSLGDEASKGILVLKTDMRCADIARYLEENLERKKLERTR